MERLNKQNRCLYTYMLWAIVFCTSALYSIKVVYSPLCTVEIRSESVQLFVRTRTARVLCADGTYVLRRKGLLKCRTKSGRLKSSHNAPKISKPLTCAIHIIRIVERSEPKFRKSKIKAVRL